ncbi:hypothetical protein GCM10009821_11940 [Aeromicrobium halocynthiae]|uniref:Uncharacterized protein n=1 Tax=Aeromicrobium halocynthiae TaxID=560557 RepID=A0ABN2VVX9_9ACTN
MPWWRVLPFGRGVVIRGAPAASRTTGGPEPGPGLCAGGDTCRGQVSRQMWVVRVKKLSQPCRCLWRGFSQITMTRPWRRITLHLSQIFFTLGLTFIEEALFSVSERVWCCSVVVEPGAHGELAHL